MRTYLKNSLRIVISALVVPICVAVVVYAAQLYPDIVVKGAPWYDIRAYTSITTALAGIGASEKTLLILGNVPVASDTVIPATTHVWYLGGGKFTIATGKVLTHTGSITAGNHTIWVGPGTIVPPKTTLNLAWMNGLTNAVALLTTATCEVEITSSWTQTVDVTTPSTMTIGFRSGGQVSVSAAKTWTIQGPIIGRSGCFQGDGAVIPSVMQANYAKWWPSFAKAVADIAANARTLVVDTVMVISGNTSVPATIQLNVLSGGQLAPAGGTTTTLSCKLDAGDYQIFSGAGAIAFTQGITRTITPVWWGADPTGVADSTTELQAAFTAAGIAGYDGTSGNQFPSASYGMTVALGTGVYKVSDTLTVTGCGVSIEGDSWGGTYIWYSGGALTTADYILSVGVTPTVEATHIRPFRLKNITIRADDNSDYGLTAPRGLWMNDVHDWEISGCNFYYLYKGFYFADAWTGEFKNSKIAQCYSPSQFYSAVNAVKMDSMIFADHGGGTASASLKCQLELRLSEDVTFINCDFSGGETNTLTANVVLVNLNRAINFFGNYFERNATVRPVYAVNATPTALVPNTGTEGLTFVGNHLRSLTTTSIRSATYKWTASGSGTGEYYLELAAGGDPGTGQPYYVQTNDTARAKGTLGSLAASTWGWGDNDTLGYNTIYVRLADDSDPDSAAADYVEMVAGDIASIYARILVQGASYHRGWVIQGNEAYLDPTKYLVETYANSYPTTDTQVLQDSMIGYNTIVTGAGNIAPQALTTAGFNEPRVEKITKVITATVSNTKHAVEFVDTSGNILANVGASYNATVSTSPVNIALISDMAFVRVSGVRSDDNAKWFIETLTCHTAVASCSAPGHVLASLAGDAPASRTYAMSGSSLTLDMGSDTYKVITVVDSLKPNNIP